MRHIYLVRHGESIQNVGINEKLRIPDHAVSLTEEGHRQAVAMAMFFEQEFKNIDTANRAALWVSPYERTRQTAEPLIKRVPFASVKEDDMLTELQFGIFDSIPKEKIKELFPVEWDTFQNNRRFNGKFYARRPGGESPFDCEIRQKLFLDTLFRDFQQKDSPDNIVIIGHGAALNILRKAIFHYSHEWYEKEPNPGNCSIMKLILRETKDNEDCGYVYGKPAE